MKIMNVIRKYGARVFAFGVALAVPSLALADAPTSIDGFGTTATGYISSGNDVAVAAGVLTLGYVGFRIVKRYTASAAR